MPRFLFVLSLIFTFSVAASAQVVANKSALPEFSQVTDRLFRGGQPQEEGIEKLAELGINTIVNLRGADRQSRADEAEATALGLRYFNVPLPVWGRPKDSQTNRVLEIIEAPENGRIFIHCRDGVDRTGTIVALYRISVEGWSADAAGREANTKGMRGSQVWMRDYIDDYHERWQPGTNGQAGQLLAESDKDFRDHLGHSARVGERAVLRSKLRAKKVVRKVPGGLSNFLRKVF
jgi:protein tyrosine phosphatase (PTP) superfamily phosphohydrolase (DUF442 family)